MDGDSNADAIIRDRKDGKRDVIIGGLVNFVILAGCATWYAVTESSVALALEVIAASWLVVSGVQRVLYDAHTMVMIAERRTQLIEQKVRDIQIDLADLVRR